MKKHMQISPSAIDTYRRCPRKWAWRKLDGIESPGSHAAILGTATHFHLEEWLGKEVLPAPGAELNDELVEKGVTQTILDQAVPIALAGMKELPEPGVLTVEGWMYLNATDVGIELPNLPVGPKEIDFHGLLDGFGPSSKMSSGRPLVLDHKTTSNFRYMKDPRYLVEKDPQGVIYSAYAFKMEPDADEVDLHWNYIRTKKGIQQRSVLASTTQEENRRAMLPIIQDAAEMLHYYKQGAKALDVPDNREACYDYGGCPYRDLCGHDVNAITALFKKKENDMTINPPEQPSGAERMRALVARQRAAQGAPEPAPAPAAPAPAPEPEPAPAPALSKLKQRSDAQAAEAPAPEEKPKKRRGRPPGSKNKPKPKPKPKPESEPEIAAAPAESEALAESEATAPPEAPADEHAGRGTLFTFLGCAPVKFAHGAGAAARLELSDLIAPLAKRVAVKEGVLHYKLVEFGKGPGILAVALDRTLENIKRDIPGNILLTVSNINLEGPLLDVLIAHSDVVVK